MRDNKSSQRQIDREELLSILKKYDFDLGGLDVEPPEIEFYYGRDKFSVPATAENREILARNQDRLQERGLCWRIVEE